MCCLPSEHRHRALTGTNRVTDTYFVHIDSCHLYYVDECIYHWCHWYQNALDNRSTMHMFFKYYSLVEVIYLLVSEWCSWTKHTYTCTRASTHTRTHTKKLTQVAMEKVSDDENVIPILKYFPILYRRILNINRTINNIS